MKVIIEKVLSVLFPPSLQQLGTIELLSLSAVQAKLGDAKRAKYHVDPNEAEVGDVTTYLVRYPDNLNMRREQARTEQLHWMAQAMQEAFEEVSR